MARKSCTGGSRRQATGLHPSTQGTTLSGIAGDQEMARGTSADWVANPQWDDDALDKVPPAQPPGAADRGDGGRVETQAARLVRLMPGSGGWGPRPRS